MWQSVKLSHAILRLSLAAVFLWFGIDKFFHPAYWLNAWVPGSVLGFAGRLGISSTALISSFGAFEILVGIGLAANMFVGLFAALAAVFLAVTMAVHGFNEVLVRDIGLIGGLVSLALWPARQYRKY